MGDKTSRTEKVVWIEEALFGGYHYECTISNSKHTVTGYGNTPEEAQERAREKWDADWDDD